MISELAPLTELLKTFIKGLWQLVTGGQIQF